MTAGPIPDVDTKLREQAILNRVFDEDTNTLKTSSGFNLPSYNFISLSKDTLTDTWLFSLNGITVSTIIITYTDATKSVISTVAKS